MQVLPRLCCAALDAALASPLPPHLVICPLDERLVTVTDDGSSVVEHLDCPRCGAPLPWVQARLAREHAAQLAATAPAGAAPAPARVRPMHDTTRRAPVAGARFVVSASGREATGVLIGMGPDAVTCLVGLWLGTGRDPETAEPDVLTVSPAWPLLSGAWPVVGAGDQLLAEGLRARAVVMRPHPRDQRRHLWFSISAEMELARLRGFDELPVRPIEVREPAELLEDAAARAA